VRDAAGCAIGPVLPGLHDAVLVATVLRAHVHGHRRHDVARTPGEVGRGEASADVSTARTSITGSMAAALDAGGVGGSEYEVRRGTDLVVSWHSQAEVRTVGNCGVEAVDPRLYVLALTGVARTRQIITGPWDAPRPPANAKAPVTVTTLGQAPGGPRLRADTLAAFSWAAWDHPLIGCMFFLQQTSGRSAFTFTAGTHPYLAETDTVLRCLVRGITTDPWAPFLPQPVRPLPSSIITEAVRSGLLLRLAPELQALSPLNTTSAPQ
jgi:hypothetical protein